MWSDEVDHLAAAAVVEVPLDAQMAAWLAEAPASRVTGVGCGAGGMTVALAV